MTLKKKRSGGPRPGAGRPAKEATERVRRQRRTTIALSPTLAQRLDVIVERWREMASVRGASSEIWTRAEVVACLIDRELLTVRERLAAPLLPAPPAPLPASCETCRGSGWDDARGGMCQACEGTGCAHP